jgi:hypothetical protein
MRVARPRRSVSGATASVPGVVAGKSQAAGAYGGFGSCSGDLRVRSHTSSISSKKGILVARQEFKITYRDGATQTVPAEQHIADGKDWVLFTDEEGIVLRVPAADVQSIGRADLPDREGPFIGIA